MADRLRMSAPYERMAPKQTHRWCYTLNNYTEEDEKRLQKLECKYHIYGRERGALGTPHLQGFINFGRGKRMRLKGVKEAVGARAHLEPAKGTDLDSKAYCSKEGDFWEYGEPQGQGKRSDLESAATELMQSQGDLNAVARKYPTVYVKYGRGLRDLRDRLDLLKPRDFKTEFVVITGHPGCGKSRLALEMCAGETVFYKHRGEWWDGYHQQENVIIDDFYGWMKYDDMLRVTDRYALKVPVKGGFEEFTSRRVIITSNKNVEDWYKFERFTPAALLRRVTRYLWWEHDSFIDRNALTLPSPINY